MENVTCTLLIETTDPDTEFGNSWDFTIDTFNFINVDAKRVKVAFTYQGLVNTVEDGHRTARAPSIWSDDYIEAEGKLQTLLDVICLENNGIGFRIIERSQDFSCRSFSTAHKYKQTYITEITDLDDIITRFNNTVSSPDDKLATGLRFNRLAINEDDLGQRAINLWNVIEAIYGSDTPKLLKGKKLDEVKEAINDLALINKDEKKKLIESLAYVNTKSLPDVIAEKFKLLDGVTGEMMAEQEVSQELKNWRDARSIQSHGRILKRDSNAEMLVGIMEHILQTTLGSEINPSKYVYIIFKPYNMKEAFSTGKNCKEDKNGSGYMAHAIYKFGINDINNITRYNLKGETAEVYVVDYKSITKVTESDSQVVELSNLPEKLRAFVENRMSVLNHRTWLLAFSSSFCVSL